MVYQNPLNHPLPEELAESLELAIDNSVVALVAVALALAVVAVDTVAAEVLAVVVLMPDYAHIQF